MRVQAGFVQFNTKAVGSEYVRRTHRVAPNKYIQRLEKIRTKRNENTLKRQQGNPRYERRAYNNSSVHRSGYGNDADTTPSPLTPEAFQELQRNVVDEICEAHEQRHELEQQTIHHVNNQLWVELYQSGKYRFCSRIGKIVVTRKVESYGKKAQEQIDES